MLHGVAMKLDFGQLLLQERGGRGGGLHNG